MFHTWATCRPVDHGPQASLTCTFWLWSPLGLHLYLVTLILTGPHLDLVTLVPTWASPVSGDSGPHLDLSWTWCLSFQHGPHLDLVTLVLSLASPGPGVSRPHFDLTQTW